jgi:hypothetical protein
MTSRPLLQRVERAALHELVHQRAQRQEVHGAAGITTSFQIEWFLFFLQ